MKYILLFLLGGTLTSATPLTTHSSITEHRLLPQEFERMAKEAQQKALEHSSPVFITLSKKQMGWEDALRRANELGYRVIQSPIKIRIIVSPSR